MPQPGRRNWSLKAAGPRPIEPSKAVLQKSSSSSTSSSSWLLSSEQPRQGSAPRRQSSPNGSQESAMSRESDRSTRSTEPYTASRLRLAVDVDEVLGRFVYALNQFCLEEYDMKYDVSDYWIYEFAKIWNCSPERSHHIVHEFFKSAHFSNGIPVIPGAYDALGRLGTTCDLVVVTSRQHIIQDATLEWIDQHYPGLFQDVYFGNHFALEGVSRKKSEICKNIGASVLIDDNPSYAMECAEAGIHVLLYDWDHAYPWSKLPAGRRHPLITVVRDWEEVEQALEVLAPRLASMEQLG